MMCSAEVHVLLKSARAAYQQGHYAIALKHNEDVVSQSKPESLGRVLGLRFMGLCHYRLAQFTQSEVQLSEARSLALRIDESEQALFVANHLGATLRRMGRPCEALTVFRAALRSASAQKSINARARLLGNLGALFDEAGQRTLADEHYARYEELCSVIDDPHRLANAHGLMSRVEALRGRIEEVEWRVASEKRYAEASRDHGRLFTSLRHQAKLEIMRSKQSGTGPAKSRQHLERAHTLYTEAMQLLGAQAIHRRVMVCRGLAIVEDEQGLRHHAFRRLKHLLSELDRSADQTSTADARANVQEDLARIARALRLHGEALFYLQAAVSSRSSALSTLTTSDEARNLYTPRFDALKTIAIELITEGQMVPRNEAEAEGIARLLAQVGVSDSEARIAERTVTHLDRQAHGVAHRFWSEALEDGVFESLHQHSQQDLVRSEIVYHGAVDDLGRSAHLIVVIFERELRMRFYEPAKRLWRTRDWGWSNRHFTRQLKDKKLRIGLGAMLEFLAVVLEDQTEAYLRVLRNQCDAHLDNLRATLAIGETLIDARGDTLKATDLRNQIVHGRYDKPLPDRISVDAVRWMFLLRPDSPLARLGLVDLRGADSPSAELGE